MAEKALTAVVQEAYMSELYTALYEESIRRGLPKEWCAHPLRNMQVEFDSNLKRALASAQRNYGPPGNGAASSAR